MDWSTFTGNVLAAFLTLAVFSFLYRDNPIYKTAEHFFVGLAAGYFIVIQYHTVFLPNLWQPLTHDVRAVFLDGGAAGQLAGGLTMLQLMAAAAPGLWHAFAHPVKGVLDPVTFSLWKLALVVPFAMGLMMFAQLVKKHAWLARWPMAVVIGSFSGLALLGNAQGDLLPQIKANMVPFLKPGSWSAFWAAPGLFALLDVLWNPVLIIGVISVLIYFFFSLDHKGVVGGAATLGIGFLMISFGAAYGNTVMTRISLLIERFDFLLKPDVRPVSLVAVILFLVYFGAEAVRTRRRAARTD